MSVNSAGVQEGKYADRALYRSAVDYFGSSSLALRTTGVNPGDLLRKLKLAQRRYPDAQAVTEAIRRRVESGISIRYGAVQAGKHGDYALLRRAKEQFGSWGKALRAAGVDMPGRR